MSDNIKVVVKVRPLIAREIEEKLICHWRSRNQILHQLDSNGKDTSSSFTFDKVYDQDAQTEDVYNDIAKPIVEAATAGINGTIFAYGQTSSGKTYTMSGSDDAPGIIPMAVYDLFDKIKNIPDRDFLLRVSYIEIYNETIKDLLDVEKDKLKIYESQNGVKVDATEQVTTSPEEVLEILRKGEANRQIGATNLNEKSSRSHSIFQITIESRDHIEEEEEEGGCVNVSQLNLVDLAGSERAGQAGTTGIRFKEGTLINKSLSTLGLVIKQLSEDPNKFANYRDSKLTRILQNSLGGNAKTAIICAVTVAALEETLSTLQFAQRAKSIKNKPEINAVATNATMIQSLTKQLAKLQNQLESKKNVEENNMILLMQIEKLKKQILNGFDQGSNARQETKSRRKTWCAPGRMTTCTFLNRIEEDPTENVTSVSHFFKIGSKPSVLHDLDSSHFIPIQSACNLPIKDSIPQCEQLTLKSSNDENLFNEIIDLESSDEEIPEQACSPYHKCYGSTKTPPCILRDNAKNAERSFLDLLELTDTEKVLTPNVNDLMERLDQNAILITKLQEDVIFLNKKCDEKDVEINHMKNCVAQSNAEIQSLQTNKLQLEDLCKNYQNKLTDLNVCYENTKFNFKTREEDLLSLIEELKTQNPKISISDKPAEHPNLFHEIDILMNLYTDLSLGSCDSDTNMNTYSGLKPSIADLVIKIQAGLKEKNLFISELQNQLEISQQEIKYINADNVKKELTYIELKQQYDSCSVENSLLKNKISNLDSTINSLKENLKCAEESTNSYSNLVNDLQKRLKEEELVYQNMKILLLESVFVNENVIICNNENIENMIHKFKALVDEKNKKIDELNGKLNNYGIDKIDLAITENNNPALQNNSDDTKEKNTLQETVRFMDRLNLSLSANDTKVEEKKQSLDQSCDKLSLEIKKLEDILCVKCGEIDYLSNKVICLTNANYAFQHDIIMKNTKINSIIDNELYLNKNIENLEKALKDKTDEYESTQNSVNTLKNELEILRQNSGIRTYSDINKDKESDNFTENICKLNCTPTVLNENNIELNMESLNKDVTFNASFLKVLMCKVNTLAKLCTHVKKLGNIEFNYDGNYTYEHLPQIMDEFIYFINTVLQNKSKYFDANVAQFECGAYDTNKTYLRDSEVQTERDLNSEEYTNNALLKEILFLKNANRDLNNNLKESNDLIEYFKNEVDKVLIEKRKFQEEIFNLKSCIQKPDILRNNDILEITSSTLNSPMSINLCNNESANPKRLFDLCCLKVTSLINNNRTLKYKNRCLVNLSSAEIDDNILSLRKKYNQAVSELEKLRSVNNTLVLEKNQIDCEVRLLLECSNDLNKQILKHRTNLSTLTALTYTENRLLKSQVKALQHHHNRLHVVCQKEIPKVKKQLVKLLSILRNESTSSSNSFQEAIDPALNIGQSPLAYMYNDFNFTLDSDLGTSNISKTYDPIISEIYESVDRDNINEKEIICTNCQECNVVCHYYDDQLINHNLHLRHTMKVVTHNELQNCVNDSCNNKHDCRQFHNSLVNTNLSQECKEFDKDKYTILLENASLQHDSYEKLTNALNIANDKLNSLQAENDTLSTQLMDNICEVENLKKEIAILKATNDQLSSNAKTEDDISLDSVSHKNEEQGRKFETTINAHNIFNDLIEFSIQSTTLRYEGNSSESIYRNNAESNISSLKGNLDNSQISITDSSVDNICVFDQSNVGIQSHYLEKMQCLTYYLEKTGNDQVHISNNIQVYDLMKMLYEDVVNKYDIKLKQLQEKLTSLEKETNKNPLSYESEDSTYNVDSFRKTLTHLRSHINSVQDLIGTHLCDNDISTQIISRFSVDILQVIDRHFSLSSAEVFNLIVDYCLNTYQAREEEYKQSLLKKQNNEQLLNDKLKLVLIQLSNKENVCNLLENQKQKIYEINKALTLDIIRKDTAIDKIMTDVHQKLLDANIVKSKDIEVEMFENKNFLSICEWLIYQYKNNMEDYNQQIVYLGKEKEDVLRELNYLKVILKQKETDFSGNIACIHKKLLESSIVTSKDIKHDLFENNNIIEICEFIINRYKEICEEFNLQVHCYENEKQCLSKEVNLVKCALEEKNKDEFTLKEQIKIEQDINNNLKMELKEKYNEVNHMNSLNEPQQKELQNYIVKTETLSRNVSHYKELVDKLMIENDNYKKDKLLSIEKESHILLKLAKLNDLENDYQQLKKMNHILRTQNDEYIQKLKEYTERVTNNENSQLLLTTELSCLKELLNEKTTKLNMLIDALNEMETLKQENISLSSLVKELTRNVEEKWKECCKLQKDIKLHEESAQMQSNNIARLEKQNNELASLLNDNKELLLAKTETIDDLRHEYNLISETLKSNQDEISTLHNLNAVLEAKVTELDNVASLEKTIPYSLDATASYTQRRRQIFYDSNQTYSKEKDDNSTDYLNRESRKTNASNMANRKSIGSDIQLISKKISGSSDHDITSYCDMKRRMHRQSMHDLNRTTAPEALHVQDYPSMGDTNEKDEKKDAGQLKIELDSCRQELANLKELYRELDEECETCASYLRERDEQCFKLIKEKKQLKTKLSDFKESNQDTPDLTRRKRRSTHDQNRASITEFVDATTNTCEDYPSMGNTNGKDEKKDTGQLKIELDSCRQELTNLKELYRELDEECETCATYLRERDEQCFKLIKEKKQLETKLLDFEESSQHTPHLTRKKRQSMHDQNREPITEFVDATTNTCEEDLLGLSSRLLSVNVSQPSVYVATGSAIVQNQQISDIMKENQKLKKMNIKLMNLYKKRPKATDDDHENVDPMKKI